MDRPELLGSAADSRGIRRHRQTADVKGRSITHSQWECLITPKYRLCIVIDAVQNVVADCLCQLSRIVPGFRILLIQIVLQGAVRLCLENFHHEFADIQADPPVVSGAPLLRRSHQILREVPHQLFAIQPLDSLIQLRLDVRQPQTALGVGGGRAGRRGSQPLLVCLKGLQQIVQHFRQQGKVPTVQILQLFPEFPQRVLHVCAFPHAIIGPDIIPDRLHVVVIGPLVADAKETFRAEIGAGLDNALLRTVQIHLLGLFVFLHLPDRTIHSRLQVIAVEKAKIIYTSDGQNYFVRQSAPQDIAEYKPEEFTVNGRLDADRLQKEKKRLQDLLTGMYDPANGGRQVELKNDGAVYAGPACVDRVRRDHFMHYPVLQRIVRQELEKQEKIRRAMEQLDQIEREYSAS